MIMNSNRALWQAGKLEMKGKLIVLDLMEVAVCIKVYVSALGGWGDRGCLAGAGVAGTGQMWYTAESHGRLALCLDLSF